MGSSMRRRYLLKGFAFLIPLHSLLADTYVVQAGSEFKLLQKNSTEDACMASPAIADGSLILRTYSKLYRIGTKGSAD
jgi:hypothetical protein